MSKFKYVIFSLLLLLCFLPSCKKDDKNAPVPTALLLYSEVFVENTDTLYDMYVYSEGVEWELKQLDADKSWAKIEKSVIEGDTSRYVPVTFDKNNTLDDRSATFVLSYTNVTKSDTDTLVLTQYGEPYNLIISGDGISQTGDTLICGAEANNYDLTISSNVEWSADIDASWAVPYNTGDVKSMTESNLTVVVEENSTVRFRKATLTVTQDGDTAADSIMVFQRGTGNVLSDSLCLVELYNSSAGASWANKWDLSKPVTEWYGVVVTETLFGQRVTQLNLGSNNLEGTIPTTINNLDFLTILDLHDNKLSGEIPSTVGSFVLLRYLYLHKNMLTGEIPEELLELEYLLRLHLGNNQLEGGIIDFSKIESLNILGLQNNNLTGILPSSLAKLYSLSTFMVYGNRLSGAISDDFKNSIWWKRWNYPTNICPQQENYGFSNCD